MANFLKLIPSPPWPLSLNVLFLVTFLLAFGGIATRPSFPRNAPNYVKGWPVFGSIGWFRARSDFLTDGKRASESGQFSFHYGPHAIVALSGKSARATMFCQRGLDFSLGFQNLFAAGPNIRLLHGNLVAYFNTTLKRYLNKERLTDALFYLVNDTHTMLMTEFSENEGIIAPFDSMWTHIYRLTHRALGCHDIAEDPELLSKTLARFSNMQISSPLEIMFPYLPTPRIVAERRRTGRRREDMMQVLIDQGEDPVKIGAFTIGALFAGVINTGINAAWVLCFLAQDHHWYSQTQQQVDVVLSERRYETESPVEIFQRLTLEEWESEFSLIDLGLRDSIRLNIPGASMRKNISGKDITIGDTGEVIPKDAYAVYLMDDTHFSEEIYEDPWRWDPGRFLPSRAEDKKVPNAYLGWGTGLHPCLGTRFAKLEIIVSTALFMAYFDFHLCNEDGTPREEPVKVVDRNQIGAQRAEGQVCLKLKSRV
ncbi:Fc.00g074950.m01.CDS01 [Cosmosporella sp. VM-42]